ncbi:hypothetical protein ACHHYP_07755 [Achlya hypogyna]|uniref:Sugar phosphate transporter domain-containing protein n=1 Tax=Achlya hypogyna TaxID=1202772 RepID=A0A1V9ZLJ5_ACHHY|nr:hypothetical protein ACHHYP_07755 [Achlya hypogyna]
MVGFRALAAALWPCAFYLLCSMSMNVLTKTILTTYAWRAVLSLAALQHIFTVSVLSLLHAIHVLRLDLCGITWAIAARRVGPLVLVQSANTVAAFVCMRLVNMPMYLVLRRLTTVKVMLMEIFVLHKTVPDCLKAALLVTAFGSILAGYHDTTSDTFGCALVLVQNCLTAGSLVLAKQAKLPPLTLVYLSSVIGGILLVPAAWLVERDLVVSFVRDLEQPAAFTALFIIMSSTCLLYQVAIQLCTARTSPLATSVTGNVKDLASTLAGFRLFADAAADRCHVLGVAVSFVGAYAFSYCKYHIAFTTPRGQSLGRPWREWLQPKPNVDTMKPKAY